MVWLTIGAITKELFFGITDAGLAGDLVLDGSLLVTLVAEAVTFFR